MPQALNRLLDAIWVLKKSWQPSVAQEGQPTSWAISVKDKEQLGVRVSYKTEPESAKTTYKLNLFLWYPAELSPVHMDLWGRIWQSVLLHTQKVSLAALARQHGPAALPLTMIDDLKAAQGNCSWFSNQKATAEIQRLQQALVQQLRLHACIYRSALRRASKPVCAALEEWAQQDGSSKTEPALRQLAAQILELVTQLEQAVANLKQVHKACCSNGMPAAVQQACLLCLEFIHYEAEQALLRVLQAGLHCSESSAAQPQPGSLRKISQDLRDSSRSHAAAVRSTPRLKHPLDLRMPLLFDNGPPSSNPSQNSPSGDSRSSAFGDLAAAPASQGVAAAAGRSSEAGARDRALWGDQAALLEAPDMQDAQRLVGESICSLQERSRQMGFAGCILQNTDSLATEHYTTWLKNLKRSVKSAMSLKAKVKPQSQLLADVVGSVVAAFAMGWAILSVYIGQRLIGVNLNTGPNQLYAPVFLICVIVGYVIKDRIKEFGKRYLQPAAKRCGAYFPDRVVELLDHHSAVVGSCKEDCKVIDERKVSPKIRELRHVAPKGPQWLPGAEELQPELVMVYSKKMQVRWRQLQGLPQVGLDDTMKFDLSPLCRHMQPEAEPHYRVLKDGGGHFKVEEVECSRAYRLHLVLQIQSEAPAGATTQLQKACVVMDRTGIKRLELDERQRNPTDQAATNMTFSSGRRLGSSRPGAKLRIACSATAPAEVERSGKAAQQSIPDAAQGMPPKPIVKIDNQTDPFATVVSIKYGDKLGELLDTTAALRNLGLNIRRAKVARKGDQITNKFYITDQKSSEKIVKSARLQEIQATIFSNLMLYHPEAEEELGWGARAQKPGASWPTTTFLGPRSRSAISTMVQVLEHENGDHSEVFVETADRAGLLTTIVQTLKDLNVNVVAAEVDTEGSRAIDKFYVTYHGEPLNPPMVQLVTNTLQYTLSLAEVEKEESY